MQTVRFGVIGAGLMGREFASAAARWCHLLDHLARPEIVAVADPNPDARAWFERAVPTIARSTGDFREILPHVDAVYAAVPHHLHEEVYTVVVRAGKHLLAEKPFGIDLAAAKRIVAAIPESVLVRCYSECPFFPAAQRIAKLARENAFGRIIEVRAEFNHASDLDPMKPINWKRQVAFCGEYGCLGDLGMHVCHLPFRAGWRPRDVRALLSKIVEERPDGKGGMAPCETWDNATLACTAEDGFPLVLETRRISPGDTNSWSIRVLGTELSAEYSTHRPKTLRTMPFIPGQPQAWREEDLGQGSVYPVITGNIFEFGFSDAILQMWAAFLGELAGDDPAFPCASPEEALLSHRLFTAALRSHQDGSVEPI